MMANRLVGLTRNAFPTTFRVLLGVFLVGGLFSPGVAQGAELDQDIRLESGGNPIAGSSYSPQIKSFGAGKLGIVSLTRKYVEWDVIDGVTCVETLPASMMYGGLAYHNGQARVGAAVNNGGTTPTRRDFVEFTRTGPNTWISSATGYTSPLDNPNFTYDVNPVTGDGAFFVKSQRGPGGTWVGLADIPDRLYIYRDAGTWTHSVIEADRSTTASNDTKDILRFSPDGTPWMFWNLSLSNTYKGGSGTPESENFVDLITASNSGFHHYNMAFDDNGVAHVIHSGPTSTNKLRYQKWTGSGWSSTSSSDYIVENTLGLATSNFTVAGFAVGPDGVNKAILTRSSSSTDYNLYLYTWGPGSTSWTKTTISKTEATYSHLLTYDCVGNLYGFYIGAGPTYSMHVMYNSERAAANLYKDSSFENFRPMNVHRPSVNQCYLEKLAVRDDGADVGAHHGSQVLNFRSLKANTGQQIVLDQPFKLNAATASFTVWVRARSTGSTTINFSLYDSPTSTAPSKALGSYAHSGNDAWVPVQVTNASIDAAKQTIDQYIGFTVTAPSSGCEIDLDQIGVFAGSTLPLAGVDNSSELHIKEAEELANGTSWIVSEQTPSFLSNGASGEYVDGSSRPLLCGGYACSSPAEDAVWNLTVKHADYYDLVCRFVRQGYTYVSGFEFEIRQNGNVLATRAITNPSDPIYGSGFALVWHSVRSNASDPLIYLEPGPVQVRLKRDPARAISGEQGTGYGDAYSRRIDVLMLTNDASYSSPASNPSFALPRIEDFFEPVYVRYVNTASSGQAYCLMLENYPLSLFPGALSRVGLTQEKANGGYGSSVLADQSLWIGPGQSSPWVLMTPNLLRRLNTVEHINKLQTIATRGTRGTNLVTEPFSGRFEFAAGPRKQVLTPDPSFNLAQTGDLLRIACNSDTASLPEQLYTSWDCYQASRDRVDELMESHPLIDSIEVMSGAALLPEREDSLLSAELELLRDMGFNNCHVFHGNNPAGIANKPTEFLTTNTLHSLGLSGISDFSPTNMVTKATVIGAALDTLATTWTGQTSTVLRAKDGDERSINSLSDMLSPTKYQTGYQAGFATYLQGLGLELDVFGESSWDNVLLKSYDERATYPEEYYYTQLYRLDAFRNAGLVCQAQLQSRFPNARSYNNPTDGHVSGNGSFVAGVNDGSTFWEGYDYFTAIRNGFGMGAAEGWNNLALGPITNSYTLAIVRSACRPENKPFISYICRANPKTRTALYEAFSSGAKYVNAYTYGPYYSGVDAWSANLEYYQHVMEPLAELGRANADFAGTTRQPADVAILYNRTAGIWDAYSRNAGDTAWEVNHNAWERDAQFIYYALRHCGYNVDIIPEEDVENAEVMSGYKVLYVNGRHIRQSTANAIATWLNSGSGKVLVGTSRVGLKNEFDADMSTLNTLFGLTATTKLYPTQATLDDMPAGMTRTAPVALSPAVTMDEPLTNPKTTMKVCYSRESLTPAPGTTVIGSASSVTLATKRDISTGQGTNHAIRYGFYPGMGYVTDAIDATGWAGVDSYCALGYDEPLANVVAYGASLGAAKVGTASIPMVELTRFDKPGMTVLFVINHRYDVSLPQTITIDVPNCAGATAAASSRPNNTLAQPTDLGNGWIRITLPMDRTTDIVRITY